MPDEEAGQTPDGAFETFEDFCEKEFKDIQKQELLNHAVKLSECLWGETAKTMFTDEPGRLNPYIYYLHRELTKIHVRQPDLNLKLGPLLEMVGTLKNNVKKPRRLLVQLFKARHLSDANADYASALLDFCVKIWLMIDVNERDEMDVGLDTTPAWSGDSSLKSAISEMFGEPTPDMETYRWPYNLNMANLNHIGGFNISFTSNLRNHLVLQSAGKSFSVFQHATILSILEKEKRWSRIFPDGFLWETKQSLAVLLPKYSTASRKWYLRKYEKDQKADDEIANQNIEFMKIDNGRETGNVRRRGIARTTVNGRETGAYLFWRQRLLFIKEAFDQTEPDSFSQWWADTRHSANRAAFWIGIISVLLAVLFGLAQTVVGILQLKSA